ncbi:MAG: ABC transporter ATP-binding protein [Candidatus Omnitrophica bacterium]|nr:ABC transporter ATP-binding protein [Candidatus Omnitrophota bacterium]
MSLVVTKNLSKNYNGVHALENLSLTLERGEILGLLGPNGAGKTTAIHILLGLLKPTSGEVEVLGMSPLKDRHKISERINFSFFYTNLTSNLKIKETLNIYAKLYGVKNAAEKVGSLLELFQISHLRDRAVGALSSGEKTRLNLVKSLLNDPELLLLDEPTASLDPEMADNVRKILKKIQNERHIGMLYTSHNMPEVEEICDRIIFINKGKTIAQGTAAEVTKTFESKNLEQVFIKIVRGNLVSEARP